MTAELGKQVLTSMCQSGAAALTALRGSFRKTELGMGVFAATRLKMMHSQIEEMSVG